MKQRAHIVNVFSIPYHYINRGNTTFQEASDLTQNKGYSYEEALRANDKLEYIVSTPFEAAAHMLRKRADNCLEYHIDDALEKSSAYRTLLEMMPQHVPEALKSYQANFLEQDWMKADDAIKTHGVALAEDQYIFHGGRWPNDSFLHTTSRPLSSSLCPQVALRNAEWNAKAYDTGRVDLLVICVKHSNTMAYAYSREGEHGNEKEIVFASGAQLKLVREQYICNVKVSKNLQISKEVPGYVQEVEIS